jgi:hypothetical protein
MMRGLFDIKQLGIGLNELSRTGLLTINCYIGGFVVSKPNIKKIIGVFLFHRYADLLFFN